VMLKSSTLEVLVLTNYGLLCRLRRCGLVPETVGLAQPLVKRLAIHRRSASGNIRREANFASPDDIRASHKPMLAV